MTDEEIIKALMCHFNEEMKALEGTKRVNESDK